MAGLMKRIAASVAEFGDRTAHTNGVSAMTYRELWGRANALANWLDKSFPDNHAPVAVHGHKEPEIAAAFIGSVLAGRAYVPLDQSLPEARIEAIVETALPAAVLTPEEISKLTADWESCECRTPSDAAADDAFYIMFTSGSTGNPKGVVITHGCLEAYMDWMLVEQTFVRGAETFLNQAPFSFDISGTDLWLGLITGGTVVSITKDDVSNPAQLYAKLRKHPVTTWGSTPSFVQMCMVERSFGTEMMPHLQRFILCGETLAHKTASTMLTRFPKAEVWNTYGPTEATIATTSVLVNEALLKEHNPLPIGRSMIGSVVSILSPNGTNTSDGERGEIIITGPNVSPGYLKRPDLTEKVFFTREGQRAYKTGDRGYEKDGLIFFEGRMDFQVKLFGHRIELGDVESNIRAVPGIIDAVVLPVERRGIVDSLAAFVVAREMPENETKAAKALRETVGKTLPEYMLPRKIIFLESFPMNTNGKADRKALAARLA